MLMRVNLSQLKPGRIEFARQMLLLSETLLLAWLLSRGTSRALPAQRTGLATQTLFRLRGLTKN
jgi:hypothetical protein